MTTKQDLHRLVGELPECGVPEAARLLEKLTDELAGLPAAFRDAPEDYGAGDAEGARGRPAGA